jgi:hypothetical protein
MYNELPFMHIVSIVLLGILVLMNYQEIHFVIKRGRDYLSHRKEKNAIQ